MQRHRVLPGVWGAADSVGGVVGRMRLGRPRAGGRGVLKGLAG